MKTLRVAIVIDSWKLPIYKRVLKRGGFTYEQSPGLTPDTITLVVETTDIAALTAVVKTAAASTTTGNRKLH